MTTPYLKTRFGSRLEVTWEEGRSKCVFSYATVKTPTLLKTPVCFQYLRPQTRTPIFGFHWTASRNRYQILKLTPGAMKHMYNISTHSYSTIHVCILIRYTHVHNIIIYTCVGAKKSDYFFVVTISFCVTSLGSLVLQVCTCIHIT